MRAQAPSMRAMLAVVGFAIATFALGLYAWVSFGGPTPFKAHGYRFAALYREAVQVPTQADVRISGVDVGHVVGVDQTGPYTRLEIELDSQYAPIPADTRTIVRRKTLLGEAYVELSPGTPISHGGRPLADGGQLPLSQSQTPVDFDEVLRAFDPGTRRSLQVVLAELGRATGGNSQALSDDFGNLPFAVSDTAALVKVLRSQRTDVRSLVRDSGATLTALARDPGALGALIRNSSRVLRATAARNAALTETVRIMPTFLDELRPTLRLSRQVGTEAAPLLDRLEPAARRLPGTLRDLGAAAPSVRELFRTLPRLKRPALRALPATTRLLTAARPLVGQLYPALRNLVPTVEWLVPYRRELTAWMPKLAAVAQGSDDIAHFARFLVVLRREGLSVYDHRLPSNRHNPYGKPGYLDKLGRPNLLAFDCANAAPAADAPPCHQQGKFHFRGFVGSYPHVERAR